MHIFLDTEYTDEEVPFLISFGLVAGAAPVDTRYVELTDTWHRADCSPFVRATVLPALMGGSYASDSTAARVRVQAWVDALPGEHEVVTDFPEIDMRLFRDWLGTSHWPENLAASARRLDTAGLPAGEVRGAAREAIEQHQQQWGAHNALVDADRLRTVYGAVIAAGCDPFGGAGPNRGR